MRFPMLVGLVAASGVLVGCGQETTTKIGGSEPNGVLKRDADTAHGVADQASTQVKQGEQDLTGK